MEKRPDSAECPCNFPDPVTRGNMGHEPELKFWMKFRMKYWMTGFETFDFFAWFFQYLDIQFQAHAEK